jgi:hypothetical protein
MLIDPHLSARERDRVRQGCCQLRQGPQTGLAAGLPTQERVINYQLQPNFIVTSTLLLYRIEFTSCIRPGFPAFCLLESSHLLNSSPN